MLILIETASGYGLFRLKEQSLMSMDADALKKHFESNRVTDIVSLEHFSRFKDSQDALAEASALIESKIGKGLKKVLKKITIKNEMPESSLCVVDKNLGVNIKNKFGLNIVYSPSSLEIIREINTHLDSLITSFTDSESKQMQLSLSHSLNRFKLKFSPEKVDLMIIQAIGLLDDLDRELNNFSMRLKEWYGWHFPELQKIVTDNKVYAQVVQMIGFRENVKHVDFKKPKVLVAGSAVPDNDDNSSLRQPTRNIYCSLDESFITEIKGAAEVSMGTDITQEDLDNIFELAQRVEELSDYRLSLADYLKFRMHALAPNVTHMVGELVGARLISHSGSLMGLAKHPSSTIQILGAEKALFRALKAKTQTPKYGLIYHAALVGQTSPKHKGKISRVLAAKLSLCIRVDALGLQEDVTVAVDARTYVENKLGTLNADGAGTKGSSTSGNPTKYIPNRALTTSGGTGYDSSADIVIDDDQAMSSSIKKKRPGGLKANSKLKRQKTE